MWKEVKTEDESFLSPQSAGRTRPTIGAGDLLPLPDGPQWSDVWQDVFVCESPNVKFELGEHEL